MIEINKSNHIIPLSHLTDMNIDISRLTFPPGVESQTSCTNVTIVSDGRLEDEETFCLTLVSSDPDVTVASSAVTCIVITDVDSK